MAQAESKILCSEIQKPFNSTSNKEEFSQLQKESIAVPIYKKCDNTNYSNYRWISVLPTTYKTSFNIFLSRLTRHVHKITVDHQCGFCYNWSSTMQIFCIHQILEKKWENNETVHQLFTDFIQLGTKYCTRFSLNLVYQWRQLC